MTDQARPQTADLPDDVRARIESGIADYHRLRADNDRLREELLLSKRDHELSRLECDALKRALETEQSARLRDVEEAKRDVATVQGKLEATGHKLAQYEVLFGLIGNALEEFKREGETTLPRIPLIGDGGLRAVDTALQRPAPGYRPGPSPLPRRQQ